MYHFHVSQIINKLFTSIYLLLALYISGSLVTKSSQISFKVLARRERERERERGREMSGDKETPDDELPIDQQEAVKNPKPPHKIISVGFCRKKQVSQI